MLDRTQKRVGHGREMEVGHGRKREVREGRRGIRRGEMEMLSSYIDSM